MDSVDPADAYATMTGALRVPVHQFGATSIDFSKRMAVMGIVNRTPDSFFDEGRTFAFDAAATACLADIDAGADILDIGGVKFAPGPPLPATEEAERVVPLVERVIEARPNAVISVDTFEPLVARRAIAAGALIINDTTGLQNPELAEIAAETGAHLVITHSLAAPREPYLHPHYDDIADEVARFLESRVERAMAMGVLEEQIIVDPGHDLNKNTVDTLELTRKLRRVTSLGFVTLAAVSNKDFVGESIDKPRNDRLSGSIAAATVCAMLGARIVRMHDVPASVDAMRMVEAIQGTRLPPNPVHNL